MALAVNIDNKGKETLDGIWDYRDDPEGIIYDLKGSSENRIKKFLDKRRRVQMVIDKKRKKRYEVLGYNAEPIKTHIN